MEARAAVMGAGSARGAPRREPPTAGGREVTGLRNASRRFLLRDFNVPLLLPHLKKKKKAQFCSILFESLLMDFYFMGNHEGSLKITLKLL